MLNWNMNRTNAADVTDATAPISHIPASPPLTPTIGNMNFAAPQNLVSPWLWAAAPRAAGPISGFFARWTKPASRSR